MGGLEEWGPDCDWASGNKRVQSRGNCSCKIWMCYSALIIDLCKEYYCCHCHCRTLQADIFEKCQFQKLSQAQILYDTLACWISSLSQRFLSPNEVLSHPLCIIICFRFSPPWYLWVWLLKGSMTTTKLLLNIFAQRRHFFLTGISVFLCCIWLPHR